MSNNIGDFMLRFLYNYLAVILQTACLFPRLILYIWTEKRFESFGVLCAWIIYRAGIYFERRSLFLALDKELELQGYWFAKTYESGKILSSWKKDYMVHKLSPAIIDVCINKNNLFINKEISTYLVKHRNRMEVFNQFVDNSDTFRLNPGLWTIQSKIDDIQEKIACNLVENIHIIGIGDKNPDTFGGAHKSYDELLKAFSREKKTGFIKKALWFILGIQW